MEVIGISFQSRSANIILPLLYGKLSGTRAPHIEKGIEPFGHRGPFKTAGDLEGRDAGSFEGNCIAMLEGLTKDFDRRLREATVQERDTGGFHLGNQNVKTALALMRYDRLIKFLREKRDAKDQG